MPVGLQCFDDAGNMTFNTDHRTGTILGAVTTGAANGSYNPGIAISWIAMLPASALNLDPYATEALPSITVSSNVISWTYATAHTTPRNALIVFGAG